MKTILFFIGLLLSFEIIAQTPVPGGPVSGTWDLVGSPYMVNGEIYIEESSVLTIEPGVQIIFTGWYKFIVYGSLLAEGTEDQNITFTSSGLTVKWWGIRFIETDKTSILDHCIVEYGKTILLQSGFPDNSGGGIFCYNSPDASITIRNSIVRYNQAWFGGGIYCESTDIQVENCEFTNNSSEMGGGFFFTYCSPVVTDCLIAYNHADVDGGGMLCDTACAIELYDNRIIRNTADVHAGGFGCAYATGFIAENNLFAHNTAPWGGGGNFYFSTGCVLKNNTFANNLGINQGGAIYYHGSDGTHTNDIFYFNRAGWQHLPNQICLGTNSCDPSFYYCNIQDSLAGFSGPGANNYVGEYLHCINSDPIFGDTLNDNFHITWQNYPILDSTRSPCIDVGEPGSNDPDGTCCDIGAYCFFQGIDIPEVQPPLSVSSTSFIAMWDPAYGALYYLLDVAEENTFITFVLENDTVYDTERLLEGLEYGQEYFYRVRAANTGVVSDYSAFMGNPVNINEGQTGDPMVYSSNGIIKILISEHSFNQTDLRIYNLAGKLICHQGLNPGTNEIDPGVQDQLVIISITVDGRLYNKKLLVK